MADPATTGPVGALRPPAAPAPAPAPAPRAEVSRWNAANLLTLVRFLLVLPFGLLLAAGDGHRTGWRLAATALFVVASATDRVDGQVARRYGLVTDLGKFADPLADKVLTGTALIGLSLLGDVPWWLTVLVLVRELWVTVLRSAVARIAVIAASRGGKAKTVLLTVAITVLLLPVGGAVRSAGLVALVAAAVVSTATGVDYTLRAVRLVRSR